MCRRTGGVGGGPLCVCQRTNRSVMYATAQNLLRWSRILATVKFRGKAIAQNVGVRTGKGSVDNIDGFLDQTKRVNK